MIKQWQVYILRCSDNSLYTGITNDIEKRLHKHNSGRGAKYTKTRRPVVLVFQEEHETRSAASKREYEVKQYSKEKKEEMVKDYKIEQQELHG